MAFAQARLSRILSNTALSRIIETEPQGPDGEVLGDEPLFLNAVVIGTTALDARSLLDELLAIERAHGRTRISGPGRQLAEPRTLDLDLLLLGDFRIEEPDLVVPHPRLEERTFVLEPLCQVAPDLVLASGLTVRQRLEELLGVRR